LSICYNRPGLPFSLGSQSLQDYTCNFLAKYWESLQHSKKEVINSLSEDFEKLFLRAYKSKLILRIDLEKGGETGNLNVRTEGIVLRS